MPLDDLAVWLRTKEFFTHFNFLIKEVDDEDDFEFNFNLMIDECFNGVPNSWLQFIYLFRHQWSKYFVDINEATGVSMKKICHVFKKDPCDPSVKLDERLVEIDLAGLNWTCRYLSSILEKYILKRWTKNARGDIGAWSLPQNDRSSSSTFALRHQAYCASIIQISSLISVEEFTPEEE
ncbi:hypothetical protein LIER_18084 [Lithospermum erythrorhizon]|uniref:Uncharacterized protein n=1 Tax=Lithospermum erythrorhizon TaxID=34254 RepID=A0AAV3QCW6_LITER